MLIAQIIIEPGNYDVASVHISAKNDWGQNLTQKQQRIEVKRLLASKQAKKTQTQIPSSQNFWTAVFNVVT